MCRIVSDVPLWVLWVVGPSAGRGVFSPKVFTSLRAAKEFVESIEGRAMCWREDRMSRGHDGPVVFAETDSVIFGGASWMAATSPLRGTEPQPSYPLYDVAALAGD